MEMTSSQLSWMRSELSNVRTLLSWVRTSVSMIGFGFTIYNFYSGVFEDLGGGARSHEAARNLGLALVGFGTLAMIVALWNFSSLKTYLDSISGNLHVPEALRRRWIVSYVAAAVILVIGLITFLFMLQVI
jgi:putative membrane protein